jgi:hypothetical protein
MAARKSSPLNAYNSVGTEKRENIKIIDRPDGGTRSLNPTMTIEEPIQAAQRPLEAVFPNDKFFSSLLSY